MYGNSNKLRLPFSSIRDEFIVARAREHLQYAGSMDDKASGAGIIVRTRKKWKAADALQQAEARLRHKALLGTVAQGRARFGSSTPNLYYNVNEKERRRLVQEEVRASSTRMSK